MCKHVAAVLYGVGARLDVQPELLFLLRGVNHEELIEADAAAAVAPNQRGKSSGLPPQTFPTSSASRSKAATPRPATKASQDKPKKTRLRPRLRGANPPSKSLGRAVRLGRRRAAGGKRPPAARPGRERPQKEGQSDGGVMGFGTPRAGEPHGGPRETETGYRCAEHR